MDEIIYTESPGGDHGTDPTTCVDKVTLTLTLTQPNNLTPYVLINPSMTVRYPLPTVPPNPIPDPTDGGGPLRVRAWL